MSVWSALHYYRYPQYSWVPELARALDAIPLPPDHVVIDAPCGDGIITYWLARRFPTRRFEAWDIEPRIPDFAAGSVRATVRRNDLRRPPPANRSTTDVWLLVNSLYCLTDADGAVDGMRSRCAWIVGVFPHLDHENYRCFRRAHADFRNPSAMSFDETVQFFARRGYDLMTREDVTRIPFHCWTSRSLEGVNLRLFILFDRILRHRAGAYWVASFARRPV